MHIFHPGHISWLYLVSIALILSTASRICQAPKNISDNQCSDKSSLRRSLSSSDDDGSRNMFAAEIKSRDDDEDDDDLRIRHMQITTTAVPIWRAASALEMFYESILAHAIGPWANLPLQSHLAVKMGCLQLTMTVSYGFGMPRSIPWSFVRNYSRNMLMLTRLGFVGTYVMWYSSVFGGFNPQLDVHVELRIRHGCI